MEKGYRYFSGTKNLSQVLIMTSSLVEKATCIVSHICCFKSTVKVLIRPRGLLNSVGPSGGGRGVCLNFFDKDRITRCLYTEFIKPGASMESRHFRTGQKKYFENSFVLS